MADDRKQSERDAPIIDLPVMPLMTPEMSAADSASKASYALWLQLQYQQQLAALATTFTAAAAHELSQPSPHSKKEPLQNLHAFPYGLAPGPMMSPVSGMPQYPYRQPGFANKPVQDPSAGVAICTATCAVLLASTVAYHALSHPYPSSCLSNVV